MTAETRPSWQQAATPKQLLGLLEAALHICPGEDNLSSTERGIIILQRIQELQTQAGKNIPDGATEIIVQTTLEVLEAQLSPQQRIRLRDDLHFQHGISDLIPKQDREAYP